MTPSISVKPSTELQIVFEEEDSYNFDYESNPVDRAVSTIKDRTLSPHEAFYEENCVMPKNSSLRKHIFENYISKGFRYEIIPDNGVCDAVEFWINQTQESHKQNLERKGVVKNCVLDYMQNHEEETVKEIVGKVMDVWKIYSDYCIYFSPKQNKYVENPKATEMLECFPKEISNLFKANITNHFLSKAYYTFVGANVTPPFPKPEAEPQEITLSLESYFNSNAIRIYTAAIQADDPSGDRFALWAISKQMNLPISSWIETENKFYSIDFGPVERDVSKIIHLIRHYGSFGVLLPHSS